jgi:hypothetical protein
MWKKWGRLFELEYRAVESWGGGDILEEYKWGIWGRGEDRDIGEGGNQIGG